MERFIIKDKIANMIDEVHVSIIKNVPKTHSVYRDQLLIDLFELYRNTIRANQNMGNIRSKYQKEVLVNIASIDMEIGLIKKCGFIENKKFMSIIANLNEIKKWYMVG